MACQGCTYWAPANDIEGICHNVESVMLMQSTSEDDSCRDYSDVHDNTLDDREEAAWLTSR